MYFAIYTKKCCKLQVVVIIFFVLIIQHWREIMARVCAKCGKGRMTGNSVSHSNVKTKRVLKANLHKVSIDIDGKTATEYVCTKCLKGSSKDKK